MEQYIQNICIFICLCDFIAQLFISDEYMGLYKNISGIFIVLYLMYPMGSHWADSSFLADHQLYKRFEESMENSSAYWAFSDGYSREDTDSLFEQYVNQIAEKLEGE